MTEQELGVLADTDLNRDSSPGPFGIRLAWKTGLTFVISVVDSGQVFYIALQCMGNRSHDKAFRRNRRATTIPPMNISALQSECSKKPSFRIQGSFREGVRYYKVCLKTIQFGAWEDLSRNLRFHFPADRQPTPDRLCMQGGVNQAGEIKAPALVA